jgi:DNA-binding transcriptional regulator LsrR (DeoR family)
MAKKTKGFEAIDRWEEIKKLLSVGWHTRGEIARKYKISNRHASRILAHMQKLGFAICIDSEWHRTPEF